jgi:GDP-mannose 6-dehydrogenase
MTQAVEATQIAVLGLGYVGCVTAACLAKLGHRVVGVDRDAFKVRSVQEGKSPFYEPGLEELVRDGVRAGRLSASVTLSEAMADCEIALVCVGTPSAKSGNLNLQQLESVAGEIVDALPERGGKSLIVAIRSTVFPGTCDEVVIPRLSGFAGVKVVSNPEFMREGAAVKDFFEPALVVVGGHDRPAVARVAGLYAGLGSEPCLVSLRTAEMIKYACNAFHAVKVAFANEVGSLAEQLSIDPQEVMQTLCSDHRLNISPAYLKPGFAFGGSCLPKDLRGLVYRAGQLGLDVPLLEHALPSNEAHLKRAVEQVLELPAERLGVIGLAFKENTDDLRESPVVTLLEQLIGKGKTLRVFDPHIRLEAIYGSNRAFILQQIPHIGRLMEVALGTVLAWADHLVVTQKLAPEAAEQIRASGLPVLDLAGTGLSTARAEAVLR